MIDILYTDKYFEKTQMCVDYETVATYGVFLRHESICAIEPALEFLKLNVPGVEIKRYYEEGALAPSETPLFSYKAKLFDAVKAETNLLQRVGFACISAYNAYMMSKVCPSVLFLDMHARHAAGTDMVLSAAYGASVGSKTAQRIGARGFIGSSLDLTSQFYGAAVGMGTMPHVLIGYAGSTLEAVKLFIEKNPDDTFIVALVDYYGREYSDTHDVVEWFAEQGFTDKTLGVRLDTHGGRFAEDMDYEQSIEYVEDWLHMKGKWSIVKSVMGEEAFDHVDGTTRDSVAKILFGTGVSVANIIRMRRLLDAMEYGKKVQIITSSGFNLKKCRIMAKAFAPINMIGTGSFLPETLSETYATCDAVSYNDRRSVKVGREWLARAILGD